MNKALKYLTTSILTCFCLNFAQAAEEDWVLSKVDENYIKNHKTKDALLVLGKVSYKDPVEEIKHMAKVTKCEEPIIDQKNNSFIVHNCMAENIKQTIFGKKVDTSEDPNLVDYVQVYLMGSDSQGSEMEADAKTFLDQNYIDHPYMDWITGIYQDIPSAMKVENLKLRAVILTDIQTYPVEEKDFTKEKRITELQHTFACSEQKKEEEKYILSKCGTFKIYEVRDLVLPSYIVLAINPEAYNKPEVKEYIEKMYQDILKSYEVLLETPEDNPKESN